MVRSILAVLAGFVTIFALSTGADLLLASLAPGSFSLSGPLRSVPVMVLVLAYVGVFAVAGCYLTARLAPSRPMLHSLVLGALGLVFSVAATAAQWGRAPAWYHLLSLALVMPYAWLGGRLRERELRREEERPAALAHG